MLEGNDCSSFVEVYLVSKVEEVERTWFNICRWSLSLRPTATDRLTAGNNMEKV